LRAASGTVRDTALSAGMAFTQLNPPLPVLVIDKGKGWAFAVIDYGQEHNLIWVTALDENGEIWCAPNPKVRVQANWTLGRTLAVENPAPPMAPVS
jgi:hypothetical protein